MKLVDTMIRQGNAIFRWRSYLPLVAFPAAALFYFEGSSFGASFSSAGRFYWDMACVLLSFFGLALRIATVGYVPSFTSGRNTHEHRAAVLNKTGMYSVVRHPLYVANFIVFLGFCLALKSSSFLIFSVLAYVLYYERIILSEEGFLEANFEGEFREWAGSTPAIIPRFRLWRTPDLAFSWRTALLREYHGVLLIGAVFFGLKMIEEVFSRGQHLREAFDASALHIGILAATASFYVVAYFIRKHTSWLAAFGRGP